MNLAIALAATFAWAAGVEAAAPALPTAEQHQTEKTGMSGNATGRLTAEGARKLDPTGRLKAGIPLCPPEGDAGTGMVATNAVKQRTGNVSAGTSSFSMIVLEKELSRPYEAIDIVTTPDGSTATTAPPTSTRGSTSSRNTRN